MKNVKENQIRKCICKEIQEFRSDIEKSGFNDFDFCFSDDGLKFHVISKDNVYILADNKLIYESLSEFYEVTVKEICSIDSENFEVIIFYEE